MRYQISTLVILLLISISGSADNLLGFDAAGSEAHRKLVNQFDTYLRPEDLRKWMQHLSARPNHLGSAYGKQNAEYIAEHYRSWGFETEIETYHVLFPTPRLRLLEMVAPVRFKASLEEPALAEDATSGQKDEQLPTYNAYSIDGDVTAELVYVNYGIPEDYEELERYGISVEGKIVLARYYGSWRGIKPKVAAEKGAIGTILFSDPADDGFTRGDTYPDGGFRSSKSVQRGSVMDMPLYPGDPLTPGIGATKKAKRLKLENAPTLTRIPVLPISYADAKPLLAALGGPLAPAKWRGALEIPYHLGPGPAKVHLKLAFNWDTVELHNVIARMKGSEYPDQWVIRGNHKDAWVNGAADPMSGMVAMMAEAKAIGALASTGWRPKRTIVYAAWDGEEQGLLGSTEWAEHHAKELKKKAVAYINTDMNSNGFLRVGGSHVLEQLVNEVASDVKDPQVGVSVLARAKAFAQINGTDKQKLEATERPNLRIAPLGSGSDYTVFLQHLGIASLNLGFAGEGEYGVYHSAYDSFDHYIRFMDKDFRYGVTLAKTAGRLTLRLADAEILPFEFAGFADNLGSYIEEIEALTNTLRKDTQEMNLLIDQGVFTLVINPNKPVKAPKKKDQVPHISFVGMKNAFAELQLTVSDLQQLINAKNLSKLSKRQRKKINQMIYQTERKLTNDRGLPRRSWYTHYIYAPGFYTGYGVKTLPGVREAIEQRKWAEAIEQEAITAQVINNYALHLKKLADYIKEL
ncbi:MAG: transferrin receptor-like dimerization domain-containing protein [Gammaproteobacteria bacterium]|nr:transferrin receptor-like dimerization domain-containing protein [Gammaproteobacteria bacterium]